jgi:hypothetical protein
MGWVVNATPSPLYRWEREPVPIVQEGHKKADRKGMRCEGVNQTQSSGYVQGLAIFNKVISLGVSLNVSKFILFAS